MKKTLLFGTITILLTILGTLLLAEILLRLLPYDEGLRARAVDEHNPVFRFTPNRTATLSQDWNFNLANNVHVNNDGFVNDIDYDPTLRSPLLAVIGDSYIQAAIVTYGETVQGRLAARVKSTGRVYSFAASGAGLPQYLTWIGHARETYRPDIFLINVISNDFDESLHWHGHSPGFWRFDRDGAGKAALRLTPYEPSLVRRLLRRSSLAMYLTQNMRIQNLLDINIQNLGANDRRWVGNIESTTTEQRMADYRWAVDSFLDMLNTTAGVGPARIVLAFDGFRPQMYGSKDELDFARKSVWGEMRTYFMEEARKRGHGTIDLDTRFREEFARDMRRFEPDTDSHWNGHGHEVLADAMQETEAWGRIFARSP